MMTELKSLSKKVVNIKDEVIPKYYPIIKDRQYMHYIMTSGRAGTKSSFMAILALLTLLTDSDASVVIMRKHHNKLRKTVFSECERAITRLKIPKRCFKITRNPMQITYKKHGNSIFFTGSDSIDDTKGMIDADKHFKLVVLDELTEFFDKGEGEDEITNIIATFVRGNNEYFRMLYLYNPPRNGKAAVMQWTEKMSLRSDCIRVHTDYRDVPVSWLGQKLIDEAESMKKADEKLYNWLWLGLCTGLDELIYYMFKEKDHVSEVTQKELKNIRFLGIGIDYGQMNPTTFQCFGLDFYTKSIRGIDEYYHCGREEGQKSPSEYAKDFKQFKDKVEQETKKKILYVYIDPSAKGLAEEIKRVCPEINIVDAENTVSLGINRVQKLMALSHLFVSPKQKHLIAEMYLYEWDKDLIEKGREVPVKANDHCQDAVRYLIMGIWKYIRQLLPLLGDD